MLSGCCGWLPAQSAAAFSAVREERDALVVVENHGCGEAVAAEELGYPLLLPLGESLLAAVVAVVGGLSAEVFHHRRLHSGICLARYAVVERAEAPCALFASGFGEHDAVAVAVGQWGDAGGLEHRLRSHLGHQLGSLPPLATLGQRAVFVETDSPTLGHFVEGKGEILHCR